MTVESMERTKNELVKKLEEIGELYLSVCPEKHKASGSLEYTQGTEDGFMIVTYGADWCVVDWELIEQWENPEFANIVAEYWRKWDEGQKQN